jgi:hypothetical protein
MAFSVVRPGRHRRGAVGLALFLGLVVLAGSCSNSGFLYVSSSDRNAYFKVPADWRFFDKRALLVASGQSLSTETNKQVPWLIGFDSDPKPSVEHIIKLDYPPSYPVVQAEVQSLPFAVQDQLSLSGMRNLVYQVDRLIQDNFAEMMSYKPVTLPGGLHGIQMTFQVALLGLSNVSLDNKVIWISQVTLVDPATKKLYLFVVRCESHCYRDNKSLLDTIVQSWTVKER